MNIMSKRSRNDIINDILTTIGEEKNTLSQILFYANISFNLYKELIENLQTNNLIYSETKKEGARNRQRWYLTSAGLKLYDNINQYKRLRRIERPKRY